VYSSNFEKHLKHLNLSQTKLYAKKSKCKFSSKEIVYLRHIIFGDKVKVNPSKVEAIGRWIRPSNLKSLRGFLRLTGYYRRFIKGY